MRKNFIFYLCWLFFCLILSDNCFAATDIPGVFKEVKISLKQKDLSDKDIRLIENSVKRLIKENVDRSRIIKAITDFKKLGMKEGDLSFCFKKINELMSAGGNFSESRDIVKRSLIQAQSKGLKDKMIISEMNSCLKISKEEVMKRSNLRKKLIDQALKNAQAKANKLKNEDKKKGNSK